METHGEDMPFIDRASAGPIPVAREARSRHLPPGVLRCSVLPCESVVSVISGFAREQQ